jgi:hypothetical protein
MLFADEVRRGGVIFRGPLHCEHVVARSVAKRFIVPTGLHPFVGFINIWGFSSDEGAASLMADNFDFDASSSSDFALFSGALLSHHSTE